MRFIWLKFTCLTCESFYGFAVKGIYYCVFSIPSLWKIRCSGNGWSTPQGNSGKGHTASKVEPRRTEANRTVYLYPAIDFASIYILISCNYLWLCLALLSGHRQTCVCLCVCLFVRVLCGISLESSVFYVIWFLQWISIWLDKCSCRFISLFAGIFNLLLIIPFGNWELFKKGILSV